MNPVEMETILATASVMQRQQRIITIYQEALEAIVAQRRHVSSKAVKIARDALECGEEIAKGGPTA